MYRRLAYCLLILTTLVLFLASPLPLGAQRPDGTNSVNHFVRVPTTALLDFTALGLAPQTSLDYDSYYWFELNDADFAQLSASAVPFEEDLEAGQLRLMTLTFNPAREGEPALPAQLQAETTSTGFRLIQFTGPVKDEWLARLAASGVRLLQYYPHHSYLVWASPNQARSTEALDFVRWQGPFHPAYKTTPELGLKEGRIENVDIMFYNDGNIEATLDAIRRLGGVELQHYPSQPDGLFYNAVFQIEASALPDVARLATVLWLGYASPVPILDDEMSNQIIAGNHPGGIPFTGYNTWLSQAGVDGTGVIWSVVDTGVDYNHPDLASRIVGGYSYTGAPAAPLGEDCASGGHGTHVAGIVGGDATAGFTDSNGFLYGLGVAPGVSIFAQNSLCGSNWPPTGGWQEHSKRSVLGGAVGSNNSWTTSEGTAHSYQASERTHDIMVRDGNFDTAAVAEPHILVFSAGNSGPGPLTLTSPKEGKNFIVVANSFNQRAGSIDTIANGSSRGPAVDGRWIPTIAAPGSQIASTRNSEGGPDCTTAIAGTSNRYAFCSGTSMAAPHVSGVVALITQWWRAFNGGANPSPAMAKALVVNGAVDMGTADIPNPNEGWGRVNLTNVISNSVNVLYEDQTHTFGQTGQFWTQVIEVDNPGQPLKLTLVWSDAPGAAGANPALVNNLDLRVAAQNGTIYRGNVFSNGWSASNGSADTRNNLENVYIQNPSGQFVVTIQATNLAGDGVPYNGDITDQDFALVCTNCTSVPGGILAGTVTNAATDAPIVGAKIVASAGPLDTFTTNSGPAGKYATALPVDSYKLTVSASGYVTKTLNNIAVSANLTTTQNVALVGAPLLTATQVLVSGGDGDTVLEPNEIANVKISLKNLGFGSATNVTGVIATAHPQATLINNTSGYATIAPGATVNNTLPFQVKLSPSFVCGDPLVLTATINTATGNFIVPVTIPTGKQTPATYISSDVPQHIATTATSTLTIANAATIADVNVTLSISHTYDSDLNLFLRAPNGAEAALSTANGGSGDHYLNTIFDDEAATPITSGAPPFSGSFKPEQPLSVFDGSNPNGSWALRISDTDPADDGDLTGWRLTLSSFTCDTSPHLVLSKTANTATVQAGQRITYTLVARNTGSENATEALLVDALPAGLTFAGPVKLTPPGAGTTGAPPFLVSDLTINAGKSVTVTFPVTVNQNLAAGTRLTNTATITSSEINTPAASSVVVRIPASNTKVYFPLIIKQ